MRHTRRIVLHLTAVAVMMLQGFDLSAQETKTAKRGKRARKEAQAQRQTPAQQQFSVEGGIIRVNKTSPASPADSLISPVDSLVTGIPPASDSLTVLATDSTTVAPGVLPADSAALAEIPGISPETTLSGEPGGREGLTNREVRRLERADRKADSTLKHHYVFRDSIPISKLTAMSVVVPGLSQLYNKQEWKIPVLYGTVTAGLYFGIQQNKNYKFYKKQYDKLVKVMPTRPYGGTNYDAEEFASWRAAVDPVQRKMIKYNTRRQLLLGGALASYIYFIGDGAVNYPGELTHVKKATTLSTIFPGAGQIYNKSYWKVPIVMGGVATFAYVIDWNNRGYNRFKTAYDLISEAERNGTDRTDEFKDYANLGKSQIKRYKDSFRRNRDLCIILATGFYLLNIVDAHVDAHMRDYDISDDLSFTMSPVVMPFQLASNGSSRNLFGLSLQINF